MRRVATFLLILFAVLMLASCGPAETPQETGEPSALPTVPPAPTYDEAGAAMDDEGGEDFSQLVIGFSLGGAGTFYDQLIADIESECAGMNYQADIKNAQTAEEQIEHIHTLLSTGVSVIVIDAVDVDALETALAECETNHVPVISVIESINGLVSTLVAPDYISIGKSAGRDAVALFGDSTGACMVLKNSYDSFTMQLMTDGFELELGEDKDVSLVSEVVCEDSADAAYAAVIKELNHPDSPVNFIFAQSDALGKGALQAIEESGKDVKLSVFGGDMELIRAAADGKIRACIFFGPAALAKTAVRIADRFVVSGSYSPEQYNELRIEAAEGDDAAQYVDDAGVYAQIVGE